MTGEILGIVVAIVTIAAGLATVLSYLRGRVRVRVESSTLNSGDTRSVEIVVTNIGGKDVSLTEIGFAVLRPGEFSQLFRVLLFPVYLWLKRKRRRVARRYSELGVENGQEEMVLLKPSERWLVRIPMDYVASWLNEEEVALPYAEDTAGREKYADTPLFVERNERVL